MFQSGASRYLIRGSDPEELKKAIIHLYNANYYIDKPTALILLTYLGKQQNDVYF